MDYEVQFECRECKEWNHTRDYAQELEKKCLNEEVETRFKVSCKFCGAEVVVLIPPLEFEE